MPLLILVMLPFWSNYLIRTYAWIVLLNNEGLINHGLQELGVINAPLPLLYNEFAIVVGLLYGYLPFMVLALYSSISRLEPRDLARRRPISAPRRCATFVRVTRAAHHPRHRGGLGLRVRAQHRQFRDARTCWAAASSLMVGNLIFDQFLSARDWPFGAALAFVLIGLMMLLLVAQAWAVNRSQRDGADA